jgi:hypothetical protein
MSENVTESPQSVSKAHAAYLPACVGIVDVAAIRMQERLRGGHRRRCRGSLEMATETGRHTERV